MAKKTPAKKEALNLFEEEEKKAARRAAGTGGVTETGSVFGHLGAKETKPARAGKEPEAKPKPAVRDKKPEVLDIMAPSSGIIRKKDKELAAAAAEAAELAAAAAEEEVEVDPDKIIHIKPPIVVKDLAERMDLKPFKLIQDLMEFDVFANVNGSIEPDVAAQVCEKHGFVFEKEKREKGGGVHKVEEVIEEPEAVAVEEVEEDELELRPPVVTIMGHVDHGKTTLIDTLRGSKVAAGEAGGITQHVAAYNIERGGQRATFIDTPGHQAFTEMRARGVNVTDIVVLVVAADDGLKPTTLEAIDHARAAGVEIIVALTKIDLDRADVNRVKAQLQEKELAPEDWGGNTICVEVSAKEDLGLDDLLEMINLQAEVLELKADPNASARGTVIEAKVEPGKGATATVIIQSGTLNVGDAFICGDLSGKVKALINDQGKRIKSAGPATPVEVVGFSGVPNVGDELVEMDNERNAKKLSDERREAKRLEQLQPVQEKKSALETLFANIEEGNTKTLKLILKCDVQGSVEAISNSLDQITSKKINLDIIRKDAGPITESDVLLASASDAILVGFNTKVEAKAVAVVNREGVQVKLFSIIYELLDQIEEAMLGMLDPETREHIRGHAEIKEVFKLSSGRVAGCMVLDGKMDRKLRARVLRDRQPIYDGGFHTLRRFKDDVKEVKNGMECGIKLGSFNDYQKGDIIECYELEALEREL